jgi:hypothetical protein
MKVKANKYYGAISYYISEPFNFVIQLNNNIKTLDLYRTSNLESEECDIVEINDSWVQECYEILLAQEQLNELKKDLFRTF